MPITAGIKCAYCNNMLQSDYQMEIHLKTHSDEIEKGDIIRNAEFSKVKRKHNNDWG